MKKVIKYSTILETLDHDTESHKKDKKNFQNRYIYPKINSLI